MSTRKVSVPRLHDEFDYYSENLLKIETKRNHVEPFVLNPPQRIIHSAVEGQRALGIPPRIVVLKSRQEGVTTYGQGVMFWDSHRRSNVHNLMVAHKTEAAQNILNMTKRFHDNLPPAPAGSIPAFPFRLDTANRSKRELRFKDTDSSIEVAVAGDGGGRSYTATSVHLSELAFYENAEDTFTAIMQTVPDTLESLVIAESTPNGWGNFFHQLWLNARSGESDWVPIFIPWFHLPEYRRSPAVPEARYTDEERELAAKHSLDGRQISWRRYCLSTKCNSDRDKFDQEYGEDEQRTFLSSGRRVFEAEHVHHYQQSLEVYERQAIELRARPSEIVVSEDPKKPRIEPVANGRLLILRPPVRRHLYTAGVDISSGDRGADPCDIVIFNRHTMDVDAIWHGRQPPEMLAVTAVGLCWYYNEALMNPEANADGSLFIYKSVELGYANFYMRRASADTVAQRVTDKIGYYTSVANKRHLINCGREWTRLRAGRCESRVIVSQLSSAVYDDKDTPVWPESELKDDRRHHGDAAIALCLSIIAHKSNPDETLAPLAHTDMARVVHAVSTMRSLRSVGKMDAEAAKMIEAGFNMSAEELEEMDERLEKRDRKQRKALATGAV